MQPVTQSPDQVTAIRIMTLVAFAFVALHAQAEDPGRIYVYAQRLTPARSWLPVSCDNVAVAKIRGGAFFVIELPPGRHILAIEGGVPAPVHLAPGGQVWVRLDWNMHVSRPPIPALSVVPEPAARKEVRFLSYIGPDKMLAPSVLPQRPQTTTHLNTQSPD